METVLVIGANRGLGLGFVQSLLDRKHFQVLATTRDFRASEKLNSLTANPQLKLFELDVAKQDSREDFVDALNHRSLDWVIYNAGIYGPHGLQLGELPEHEWRKVLHVDTVAPLLMAQALLPHLRAETPGRIAFLSSKMGSIDDNGSGGSYLYRSAKAGLNAAVRSLSIDLKPDNIPVLLLHPGWVKTDMGGDSASLAVEDSVRGMIEQIRNLDMATTGSFVEWNGAPINW
ncbi:MAG: SDR family oxidoreductase [Planctomycetota bacterium]